METRASYIAVGSFVLLLMLGLFGFVIWIGKFQGQQEFTRYDILFSGSVTGLQVDGTVRYRGIAVGRVLDIRIDPDNFERIRVTIEVGKDTPVVADTKATLELQGITGGVYVQLSEGTHGMAALPKTTKPPYPLIESKESGLQQLLEGAPDLVVRANELLSEARQLFSAENKQAVSDILRNLQTISGRFAEGGGNIDSLLSNGAVAVEKIAGMATEFEALAKELRAQLQATGGGDMPTIADTLATAGVAIVQLQKTASEFELLAHELRTQLMAPGGADSPSVADLVREGTEALTGIQGMSTQFEQLAADLRGQFMGKEPGGATVGELVNTANAAAANIGSMSAEIEGLAKDLRGEFSGMEGQHGEKISGLLTEASAAARQISTMSAEFEGLAKQLRGELSGLGGQAETTLADMRVAVQEFGATAKSIGGVADQLDATIAENRGPLRDFSNSGLYELTQLLTEVRLLVASMTKISSQIERDPARFFLGDRREGFQAE